MNFTEEQLRGQYKLGFQKAKEQFEEKIEKQIEISKDFIKRNKGHCESCDIYCNEENQIISKMKELLSSLGLDKEDLK